LWDFDFYVKKKGHPSTNGLSFVMFLSTAYSFGCQGNQSAALPNSKPCVFLNPVGPVRVGNVG
jgi:hypothetical protein